MPTYLSADQALIHSRTGLGGAGQTLPVTALGNSTLDGTELVDHCFAAKQGPPVVRINAYVTLTDRSEHSGFANLLRGVFGTFRNPPAHAPRAAGDWSISEADALDLFSLLSFVHRRLDDGVVRP